MAWRVFQYPSLIISPASAPVLSCPVFHLSNHTLIHFFTIYYHNDNSNPNRYTFWVPEFTPVFEIRETEMHNSQFLSLKHLKCDGGDTCINSSTDMY